MCNQDCNQGRSCNCGKPAAAWQWIIITLVAFWLTVFCTFKVFAAPSLEDVATSTDTYALCKTMDVASTAYLIDHGLAVEANPIVKPLIANGYVPLVLVSFGLWWVLNKLNNKPVTAVTNTLTCGIAIHNLTLIP